MVAAINCYLTDSKKTPKSRHKALFLSSVAVIGGTVFILFLIALSVVKDTYGRELDYADRGVPH